MVGTREQCHETVYVVLPKGYEEVDEAHEKAIEVIISMLEDWGCDIRVTGDATRAAKHARGRNLGLTREYEKEAEMRAVCASVGVIIPPYVSDMDRDARQFAREARRAAEGQRRHVLRLDEDLKTVDLEDTVDAFVRGLVGKSLRM